MFQKYNRYNSHYLYNNKLHKQLTFLSNTAGKAIEKLTKTDGEIKDAIMFTEMREKAEQSRLNRPRKEGQIEELYKYLHL